MRYVVDACNLIFRDRKLEDTLDEQGFPAARSLLVTMLARFAAAEDIQQIIAVFDGSEKAAHRPRKQSEAQGRVLLVYADPRTNADRFIIDLVEDSKRPGEITVVTGDKFIIRHIQRSRAHHLGCRDFLRKIRSAGRRHPSSEEPQGKFTGQLSPREVDEWMRYFGFDEGK
ncbi:MAG TPA: NYN domain-containing protein [Planctomycetota bacterium]|nr:NYN domain-containing protein [Planctomycetota bacterium]